MHAAAAAVLATDVGNQSIVLFICIFSLHPYRISLHRITVFEECEIFHPVDSDMQVSC
jgi:hypothetical protein